MSDLHVRGVMDALGPVLVRHTSGDLSAPITSVVLTDPAHPVTLVSGAAVLAVGFEPESAGFATLCGHARDVGVAVVVVKAETAPVEDRVAIAVVDPEADWVQIASLIRIASASEQPESGDTLFGVAEAIAAICGGAVVIHDGHWELLAYSRGQPEDPARYATILGRGAPGAIVAALQKFDLVARIQRGDPVFIGAGQVDGLSPRYAVGVCVNGEFLGSIWALLPPGGGQEDVFAVLRRAAGVAALPLLERHGRSRNATSEQDAALASLLNGGRTERLIAARLNLPVDGGHLLAGLQPLQSTTGNDAGQAAAELLRLERTTRTYLDTYRVPHAVTGLDGTVYLLLTCRTPDDRARLLTLLNDLQARVNPMIPHRLVVSRTSHVLSDVALLRADVDQLSTLALRRGWPAELFDADAVEAEMRLDQFRELALSSPALLQGPIQRILDYEKGHPGDLARSLAVWFECHSDARIAALRLNIHVNTVRYRVRRAAEVGGINLDVAADRLLAELQARILLG